MNRLLGACALLAASATPAAPQVSICESGAAMCESPTVFDLPVEGEIVIPFGAEAGDAPNQGVDIAAETGAPVRASADGRVAFVSDATSPLGSVLLLEHRGGLVTIYGRIDAVTVRQGQFVSRGEPIAQVADPQQGGRPMLHFELRRGAEPLKPTP